MTTHHLEDAWRYWYLAEWDELLELEIDSLEDESTLAIIAALKASALLELERYQECRDQATLAKQLGGHSKFIAKTLLSNLQMTLGNLATLNDDPEKATNYFHDSIGSEVASRWVVSAPHSRAAKSYAKLRLSEDSQGLLERDGGLHDLQMLRSSFNAILRQLELTGDRSSKPKSNQNHVVVDGTENIDIVIASMRHCGSTAVFNAVRLALDKLNLPFESGYSEREWIQSPRTEAIRLIKTHEIRDDILIDNTIIINVIRDLRDTIASAARRNFFLYERLGAIEYARYNRALNELWTERSDTTVRYEEFLSDNELVLESLFSFLGLEGLPVSEISNSIRSLPTDEYETTLLSEAHITDPTRNETYLSTLGFELSETLTKQHARWLSNNHYLNSDSHND